MEDPFKILHNVCIQLYSVCIQEKKVMYSVCIQDKNVSSGRLMSLDIHLTERRLRYSELYPHKASFWAPLAHFRPREFSGPFKGLINLYGVCSRPAVSLPAESQQEQVTNQIFDTFYMAKLNLKMGSSKGKMGK